jgi:AcrR family transcriptional regulator
MAVQRSLLTEAQAAVDGTRNVIEDVALGLFLQHGYAGTSMKAIAEAAGVTPPALYWHFSSKGDLCCAALAREYARFEAAISAGVRPGPPDAQLHDYVTVFVRNQLHWRRVALGVGFDELARSLPASNRAHLAALARPLHDQLRAIVADGVRQGLFACDDPPVAAFAITTMCNFVFTWYKPGGRLTIDQVAESSADLAIRMVRGGQSMRAQRVRQ